MSNDVEKARDAQLVAAIAVVVTSGFAVENARGDARVERIDDAYHVLTLERVGSLRPVRDQFDDAHEAVRYYLDACDDT